MKGPGDEPGSRGDGKAVYFFDPDKHLIEIRHYELARGRRAPQPNAAG